jgi:hypothetical protein
VVLVIILHLFLSLGVVRKTIIGISDKIVLLMELAKLTFRPLSVKPKESSSVSISSREGFIVFNIRLYLN